MFAVGCAEVIVPPALNGVVVVGAGVGNGVGGVVVGQVLVLRVSVTKGKLKDFHSGKVVVSGQFFNVWGYLSQVFCYQAGCRYVFQ